MRAGVHTGEIEVMGDDIGGIAVHIARARRRSRRKPNQILVSRTVRDLVAGSNLRFSEQGAHALKGIDEPVPLFAVQPAEGSA